MELSLFFKNTLFSQDRWPCDYRPHYVDINMHLMSDDVVIHFFYGLYLALKIALSLLVFPKNEKKKKKKGCQATTTPRGAAGEKADSIN